MDEQDKRDKKLKIDQIFTHIRTAISEAYKMHDYLYKNMLIKGVNLYNELHT